MVSRLSLNQMKERTFTLKWRYDEKSSKRVEVFTEILLDLISLTKNKTTTLAGFKMETNAGVETNVGVSKPQRRLERYPF